MRIEKRKVGWFFIYLALILLIIFFASDQAQHPAYGFFFAGFALLLLGGYLIWRDHKPAEPNPERFRTLRKLREQQDKRKTERQERKK